MADPGAFAGAGHPDMAGWVLGVLDPEESSRFETHLESCPECQHEVAEFGSAAQMLQSVLPGMRLDDGPEPPLDLQVRTLARVQQAADKAVGKAAALKTARKSTWRRRSPRRLLSAAAAVVVAAAAAIALLLESSVPALAFTIPLHPQQGGSESGQAVAHQTGNGWSITLTVHGMPTLRSGGFYECWYAGPANRPGHPDLITAGTFTVNSTGSATVQMWSSADPRGFPVMQITTEQAGDGGQHGQILLSGTAEK